MSEDLWVLVRAERASLVGDLEALDEPQWQHSSLCEGWRVIDVAAHLAYASVLGPATLLLEMVRAGFRPNRVMASTAPRWARRGPGPILAQLHENLERDAKPMGMPTVAALVDATLHGLDIREPLGMAHEIDPDAVRTVADFCAGARGMTASVLGGGAARRIRDVRVGIPSVGWAHGTGPEVEGEPAAVLRLLSGRPVAPGSLVGPGAEVVAGRLRDSTAWGVQGERG